MASRIDPVPWGSCPEDAHEPKTETPWLPDSFAAQAGELRRTPVEDWPDDFVLELVWRLLSLDE